MNGSILNPGWKAFAKYSDITSPNPSSEWVFLDEHPDSINDGLFNVNMSGSVWDDVPASYHNGACGFSFANGHSEIKNGWLTIPNSPLEKRISPSARAKLLREILPK